MLLEVRDLTTCFFTGGGTVRAVDGVSYDVQEGETVALVGESGCGKTVTALSIMRLIMPPAGRIVGGQVLFKGRDVLALDEESMRRIRGREIAMVVQEATTSLSPAHREHPMRGGHGPLDDQGEITFPYRAHGLLVERHSIPTLEQELANDEA